METRIEIYKDNLWQPLRLTTDKAIKYNALINRVGKVSSREISHTNTFSIPAIYHNINILGLNLFNPRQIAQAMNAKYEARYYVHDKLVQQGYVVINNTNQGEIKINFIDEALSLVDIWGSTTFQELLQSDVLEFPADYETAIQELKDYDLDVTQIVPRTSEVGSRGYRLCLFPNTLNAIGDKFQLDENELRQDDVFNPFQSRPLWNLKSLFDLATETYGYTPIYDDSVDWDEIENLYIISDGVDKNKKGESGTQTRTYNTIGNSNPYYIATNSFGNYNKNHLFLYSDEQALRPNEVPNWVDPDTLISQNGTTPWMDQNCIFVPKVEVSNTGTIEYTANYSESGLEQMLYWTLWKNPLGAGNDIVNEVYSPLATHSTKFTVNSGTTDVDLIVDKTLFDTPPCVPQGSDLYTSLWTTGDWTYNSSSDTLSKATTDNTTPASTGAAGLNVSGDKALVSFTIDSYTSGDLFVHFPGGTQEQVFIFNVPGEAKTIQVQQGATTASIQFSGDFIGTIGNIEIFEGLPCEELIGTMFSYGRTFQATASGVMTQMQVTESYLPKGVVSFDKYGQYLPNLLDLDFAAPNKSIKELLSAAMHQQGILMEIDAKNEEVKFFNYGEYEQQKIAGNYSDWSKYLLKYNKFVYNTDYGNSFGKTNRIGLSDPFPGNTFDVSLDNQGLDSKYKDFNEDNVKLFKDVSNVESINNTNNPYFEFENHGLGLVEGNGTLGPFDQQRADGTSQGNITDLDHVENVNYAALPSGVKYWYRLVDEAVRVECQMLLPIDVFRNFEISEPIYVEELGGFYIVEEIKGYQDQSTPVTVKLIKLIDNLQGEGSSSPGSTPSGASILLAASSAQNFGFDQYIIYTTTSFFNYTPTAATVTITKMTGNPSSGGTETTTTETAAVTIASPYTGAQNSFASSLPITSAEEGWYKVQVTDDVDSNITSNVVYVYRGNTTPPPSPTVSAYVIQNTNNGNPSGTADIGWQYHDFAGTNGLPTTATLTWRKKDYITGNYLAAQRSTSWSTSATSGTTNHNFIDGAGFYELTLTTNEATSGAPLLGGYFVL